MATKEQWDLLEAEWHEFKDSAVAARRKLRSASERLTHEVDEAMLCFDRAGTVRAEMQTMLLARLRNIRKAVSQMES